MCVFSSFSALLETSYFSSRNSCVLSYLKGSLFLCERERARGETQMNSLIYFRLHLLSLVSFSLIEPSPCWCNLSPRSSSPSFPACVSPPSRTSIGFYGAAVNYSPTTLFPAAAALSSNILSPFLRSSSFSYTPHLRNINFSISCESLRYSRRRRRRRSQP